MSFLDGTANTATPQPQRSHNTQTRHKPQTSSSRAYPAARPTAPLRSSAPGAPACATCVADSDDVSVTLHIMPCHLRLEHCSQITGSSPLWPRVGRGGEPFRALLRAYSAPSSHPRGRWSASPARRWRACSRPRLRDTSSSARGREAWPGEPSRCPSTVGKPRARLLLPDGDRGHAPAAKGVDGDRRDGRRFPPPPPRRPPVRPAERRSWDGCQARRHADSRSRRTRRSPSPPRSCSRRQRCSRDAAETQPHPPPPRRSSRGASDTSLACRPHLGSTSATPLPPLPRPPSWQVRHRLGVPDTETMAFMCAATMVNPSKRRLHGTMYVFETLAPSRGARVPAGGIAPHASRTSRSASCTRCLASSSRSPSRTATSRRQPQTKDVHHRRTQSATHRPGPPAPAPDPTPHCRRPRHPPPTSTPVPPREGAARDLHPQEGGRGHRARALGPQPLLPLLSRRRRRCLRRSPAAAETARSCQASPHAAGGCEQAIHRCRDQFVAKQSRQAPAPVPSPRFEQDSAPAPGASLLPRSRLDASCCEQDPHSEASQALVEASEMSSLPPPSPPLEA